MYTEVAANKRKSWLLIGVFIIIVTLLGWIFSLAFHNQTILYFVTIFAVGYAWLSYYNSDKIALAASRAKKVEKKDAPELYRTVENLAITAGLPTPTIYIIHDDAPNAFATGRDPAHSVVCVTTGLLERLDKSELEGVIAHELSHVGNYDIRFMGLVVVLVAIIALLSDWFLRFAFWGSIGGDDNNSNSGGQSQAIFMAIGIVLAILAPLIAFLVQLAVSRKREYLADASGALLTRYPAGLISALKKISGDTKPLKEANKATSSLYIVNPFRANVAGKDSRSWLSNLFSTHPPIEDRIKKLETMENAV